MEAAGIPNQIGTQEVCLVLHLSSNRRTNRKLLLTQCSNHDQYQVAFSEQILLTQLSLVLRSDLDNHRLPPAKRPELVSSQIRVMYSLRHKHSPKLVSIRVLLRLAAVASQIHMLLPLVAVILEHKTTINPKPQEAACLELQLPQQLALAAAEEASLAASPQAVSSVNPTESLSTSTSICPVASDSHIMATYRST